MSITLEAYTVKTLSTLPPELQEVGEVAAALGIRGYAEKSGVRLTVLDTFPGEEPEELVAAIQDFRNQHRTARRDSELVVMRNRISEARFIVEEIIRRES